MSDTWTCGACYAGFETVSQLAAHRPACPERELRVRASVLAQSAFALGHVTMTITERLRVQQVTSFECAYCWAYVLRPEWSGKLAEEIVHKPDCKGRAALVEIEKAMKLINEAGK
jgi:hypothetical protein